MSEWFAKVAACPACGSPSIEPHFKMIYWLEYPLEFYLCNNCAARFANPMPGNEVIAKGNDALVRYYSRGRRFEHEFRDARQAYLRGKLFARKLRKFKPHGRLLEIGCYNGFFLAGIRDHCDWQVEGVEIAASLVAFARAKLKLTMHQGVLEEISLPAGAYDFIIFNDLIEHITQPDLFLRSVANLLAPKGRVQLITPNANQDTAFAKRASDLGTPIHIMLNHIMFFSPKSLRLALERAGLKPLQIYGYDIQHALKDFNVWGLGPVGEIVKGPSMQEVVAHMANDFSADWTDAKIAELKSHPKVSIAYGIIKEVLPNLFRIKIPESLGIGHELFALAERVE
jgi:2-polyprenyl-3-methyl-5-hydroxy-6-metoxy-1,4-benzoquinol methylase